MKIENKDSTYQCCHKGTQAGNINPAWRRAHKKARTIWKMKMFTGKYQDLIKRV
jgi:hypothetical protein